MDTLHQYFDYALWHGAFPSHIGGDLKPGTGFVPSSSVSNETKTSSESNPATTAITRGFPRARPAVQYASMCLGALHYMFGHMEEARRSVDESMRVAQDYGDHRCVSFIISCLGSFPSSSLSLFCSFFCSLFRFFLTLRSVPSLLFVLFF